MKLLLIFIVLPIFIYAQPKGRGELISFSINPQQPAQKLEVTTQIWYFGDMSIQEVPGFETTTDSLGTRVNSFVKYYLFINDKKKQYHYYKNLADTARLVAHGNSSDILTKRGGLDIYSNKKFAYDYWGKLVDTVMNGKRFIRFTFIKARNEKRNKYILYSLCENRNVPIKYLKPFGEAIGCPVVRMDSYLDGRLTNIVELRYVADTLSAKEREIFTSWGGGVKN